MCGYTDIWEKAMATHSSTVVWEIPWTEEPGGLQSIGLWRVWHNWATSLSLFTFMQWRRKWQLTPVFLPGESQGQKPGKPLSMGSHRVGHDWRDLAYRYMCTCMYLCFVHSIPPLRRCKISELGNIIPSQGSYKDDRKEVSGDICTIGPDRRRKEVCRISKKIDGMDEFLHEEAWGLSL